MISPMERAFTKISVVGLGYVGLPTATILASHGVEVVGLDISEKIANTINSGKIHIVEPYLDIMVQAAVTAKKLRATTKAEEAGAFVIAVPTPLRGKYEPDVTYVKNAALSIAPVLRKGNLVILESTSPVGTTEQMAAWLAAARPDLTFPRPGGADDAEADVAIAYCPERVLPGKVLQELVQNDRVIGGLTRACAQRAAELYAIFVRGECILTDSRTAEMVKLTENAYRDVNIAFANELSMICDHIGVNVWELIGLANRHPRVKILQPGPGVGGHCIAVDPAFIVHMAPEQARLIRTGREVNDHKPHWVMQKVRDALERINNRGIARPTIGCLGLTYKANIDDLRESPSLEIVRELVTQHPGQILACDPYVPAATKLEFPLATLDETLKRAHLILLLVDHKEFTHLSPRDLASKEIIDTRGVIR